MTERILIIRLGALGDLVLCFGAFQTIRKAHPQAQIALLTMPAFENFAKQMPWFDRVLTDSRTPKWHVDAWWNLVRKVRAFNPSRVYDLQGKPRQTILYNLLGGPFGGPEWSGAAPFCSHPRLWPPQPGMHFTDFVRGQLERAGVSIGVIPVKAGIQRRASASYMTLVTEEAEKLDSRFRGNDNVDLSWLAASIDSFNLPERFALFIPGCAPSRLYKRWPAERYAELARKLEERGIISAVIGTAADESIILDIKSKAPNLINLCGQTSLPQVAELARHAVCVVGNDTGPTHLAAVVGGRTLALMSDKVDPLWSSPRGPNATWLQGKPLSSLDVETVFNALFQGT